MNIKFIVLLVGCVLICVALSGCIAVVENPKPVNSTMEKGEPTEITLSSKDVEIFSETPPKTITNFDVKSDKYIYEFDNGASELTVFVELERKNKTDRYKFTYNETAKGNESIKFNSHLNGIYIIYVDKEGKILEFQKIDGWTHNITIYNGTDAEFAIDELCALGWCVYAPWMLGINGGEKWKSKAKVKENEEEIEYSVTDEKIILNGKKYFKCDVTLTLKKNKYQQDIRSITKIHSVLFIDADERKLAFSETFFGGNYKSYGLHIIYPN